MRTGITNLSIINDDQKRIRREFSDDRICFGRNYITHRLEAWYKPDNSRPYLICSADNVCHAIYLLKQRAANDVRGAKILLNEIDNHNEKLLGDKQENAMHEVRHDLRWIASGRKTFSPSLASYKRKIGATYANV